MGLNAATIELLLSKGLTGEDLLDVARSLETSPKQRSAGAERQARYRHRKQRDVTGDVTGDVTNDVTRDVTPPPKEYISNPRPLPNGSGQLLADKGRSKRGTRLAEDFEVPADWIEWAIQKRGWTHDQAVEEGENFTRYWQAKPGREASKLDWPKTWQNWVVNSRRQAAQTAASGWSGFA